MRIKKTVSCLALAAGFVLATSNSFAAAVQLEVTITNNSPTGGVAITPVWVGFHNGSFDSYDSGIAVVGALESLAELGQTGPISNVFAGTLIGNPVDGKVQGAVADGGPIFAGGSASQQFSVDDGGANNYFSYAAMVLPSNDYFVANGNPFAHDLSALLNGGVTSISFNIGAINTVNDAGTEINDFANSPGNGIAGAGVLPAGNPLLGDPENSVVTNVIGDPFAGFLNSLLPLPGTLNFNDITQYKNGIATITISVVAPSTVPVPAALPLVISALSGLFAFGRRRQQK